MIRKLDRRLQRSAAISFNFDRAPLALRALNEPGGREEKKIAARVGERRFKLMEDAPKRRSVGIP